MATKNGSSSFNTTLVLLRGCKPLLHDYAQPGFNTTLVLLRDGGSLDLGHGLPLFQHHSGAIEGLMSYSFVQIPLSRFQHHSGAIEGEAALLWRDYCELCFNTTLVLLRAAVEIVSRRLDK